MNTVKTIAIVVALGLLALGSSGEAATMPLPVTNGLQLWLETENGEGTAYNSSGGEVTAWLDQSGNGFDFTPRVNAPDLVSGVTELNGHTAVNFGGPGEDENLDGDHQVFGTGSEPTAATVFGVMQIPGGSNHNVKNIWDTTGIATPSDRWMMAINDETNDALRFGRDDDWGGAPVLVEPTLPSPGTYVTFAAVANGADPNSGMWLDGGASGSDTGSISTVAGQGTTLILGSHSANLAWFNGNMAEWIVYDRALSNDGSNDPNTNEFNAVGYYLQEKYGLEGDFVQPIPEPASVLLLLSGLLGLALIRRRR